MRATSRGDGDLSIAVNGLANEARDTILGCAGHSFQRTKQCTARISSGQTDGCLLESEGVAQANHLAGNAWQWDGGQGKHACYVDTGHFPHCLVIVIGGGGGPSTINS